MWLQAEGSGVSAELEFLNQQSLILSMENKALKQRLDSLAQEQRIKYCKFLALSVIKMKQIALQQNAISKMICFPRTSFFGG